MRRAPGLRRLVLGGALIAAALMPPRPARAEAPTQLPSLGSIYRCHSLSGALVFQDRPCRTAAGTREAARQTDGERLEVTAPPAAEAGTPAAEHYARYLEQVAADQREQRAADAAATARLQASAEADRAAAERSRAEACIGPEAASRCGIETVDAPRVFYAEPWRLPERHAPRHPVSPEPARREPRPVGPNEPPRPPLRDARSEILSLSP